MTRVFCLAAVASAILVGCSDETTAPQPVATGAVICAVDPFRADVRKGPNAGLFLLGRLELVMASETGAVRAVFVPKGAEGAASQHLEVTGAISGGEITL